MSGKSSGSSVIIDILVIELLEWSGSNELSPLKNA